MDNGGAVILKIKDGKVSAEFQATDQASALYLRQQLADLRQRMEAKNLPVGTLNTRQENPNQRRRKQQEPEETFQLAPITETP
jgi:flagellar hook-length control protein FliK